MEFTEEQVRYKIRRDVDHWPTATSALDEGYEHVNLGIMDGGTHNTCSGSDEYDADNTTAPEMETVFEIDGVVDDGLELPEDEIGK